MLGTGLSLTHIALVERGGFPGGGGGEAPEWVEALAAPSTGDLPTVALDFVNGQYWAGGEEKAAADVVDEPGWITGGSLQIAAGNTAQLIGDAFAGAVAASATIVIDFAYVTGNGAAFIARVADIFDGQVLWSLSADAGNVGQVQVGFADDNVGGGAVCNPFMEGEDFSGQRRAAFTHNGETVQASYEAGAIDAPDFEAAVPIGEFTPAFVYLGNDPDTATEYAININSITIYPAQPYLDLQQMSGGDGEAPAWVEALAAPDESLPKVAMDFENARYWFEGGDGLRAEVTINLAVNLPNYLGGTGLEVRDGNPTPFIIGDALAAFLSDPITVLFDYSTVSDGDVQISAYAAATGIGTPPLLYNIGLLNGEGGGLLRHDDVPTANLLSPLSFGATSGRHRVAFTSAPAGSGCSVDGAAADTSATATGTCTVDTVGIGNTGSGEAVATDHNFDLHLFVAYDAQANADLPTISLPPWVEALRAPGTGDLPTLAMDFVNDRYWINGLVADLADMFSHPGILGSGGLEVRTGEDTYKLIGGANAAAAALGGGTIRAVFQPQTTSAYFTATVGDYDEFLWEVSCFNTGGVNHSDAGFSNFAGVQLWPTAPDDSVYRIAFTYGEDIIEAAIDGEAKGQDATALDPPNPAEVFFGSSSDDDGGSFNNFDLHLLAAYPVQPYADLPAMTEVPE